MDNLHLFTLINAGRGLSPLVLSLSVALAQWVIYLVPLAMAFAWIRGDRASRTELLLVLLAMLIALGVAQAVTIVYPQPRPFALHLGNQYLEHGSDPGLPSDHVTVFWSAGLAALATRRFAVYGLPSMAVGTVVGWSRVFLGVHFPFDILAAFPVALAGAIAVFGAKHFIAPALGRMVDLSDRLASGVRDRMFAK